MTANRPQRYDKNPKAAGCTGVLNGYLLLKLNLNQFRLMSKCGLSLDDCRYVPMYEEYASLLGEGVPKERIYQHLGRKYFVSESTVKRVVRRFSGRVTP